MAQEISWVAITDITNRDLSSDATVGIIGLVNFLDEMGGTTRAGNS